MSEAESKYSTDHTSVKVHHGPGGQSNFSLGWDNPEPQVRVSRLENIRREDSLKREVDLKRREEEEEERKRLEALGRLPVQTSVKVKNPPGGQSTISFG